MSEFVETTMRVSGLVQPQDTRSALRTRLIGNVYDVAIARICHWIDCGLVLESMSQRTERQSRNEGSEDDSGPYKPPTLDWELWRHASDVLESVWSTSAPAIYVRSVSGSINEGAFFAVFGPASTAADGQHPQTQHAGR